MDTDRDLAPRGRGNVERKHELERTHAIACGHCPYHRGENRRHTPRSDRYKSVRKGRAK